MPVVFKIWGCFLLGHFEKVMDYLEQANIPIYEGTHGMLYLLRAAVPMALTPSINRQLLSHPRYQALLEKHGWDDAWRDNSDGGGQ